MFTPGMVRRIRATALLLVLCMGASNGYALTEPAPLANLKTATTSVACTGLRWHADWLTWFPRIVEGCRDVVRVRGQRWARLQALFVRQRDDGAFVAQLLDGKGNLMGGITLLPAVGQGISLKGRRYWFAEVIGEQRLNLYVPEGELAVASQPGAPPEQYALIVRVAEARIQEVAVPAARSKHAIESAASDRLAVNAANAVSPGIQFRFADSWSPAMLAGAGATMAVLLGAMLWLRRQPPVRALSADVKRRLGRSKQSSN